MNYYKQHVILCTNQKEEGKVCCANSGGESFFLYMKKKLTELGLHGPGKIRVSKSGCLGRCHAGPCLVIYPEGVWYSYTSIQDIDRIISHYLLEKNLLEDLLISNT